MIKRSRFTALLFCFLIFCSLSSIYAATTTDLVVGREYVIKLKSGDLFKGILKEFVSDPEEGEGIKVSTELGLAEVYQNQIETIVEKDKYYRHNHRIFLLPTADPIGKNYFVGDFEALFLYAGGGVGDFLSISLGRSIAPGIRSDRQISVLDAKISPLTATIDAAGTRLALALGFNLAFINSKNRLSHLYGVGSLKFKKSSITAAFFYKSGKEDYYKINFGNNSLDMIYANGSFGVGFGLDAKFSSSDNIRFIGEIWNSDIAKPSNSAVLIGLRLYGYRFSSDFGLAFFTRPFVAPFFSFVWTPFG